MKRLNRDPLHLWPFGSIYSLDLTWSPVQLPDLIRITHICPPWCPPPRCKVCPLTFLTKSEMQIHSKSHTEAKPHKCPHCSKTFANASYLAQHLRIHLGIKPYHCSYCENSFRQLSHLQQHTRSVQMLPHGGGGCLLLLRKYKVDIFFISFYELVLRLQLFFSTQKAKFNTDIIILRQKLSTTKLKPAPSLEFPPIHLPVIVTICPIFTETY